MLLSFTSTGGGRWVEATSFQSKGGWWQSKCHYTFPEGAVHHLYHLHAREESKKDESHWEHLFTFSPSPAGIAYPNVTQIPVFCMLSFYEGLV